MASAEQSGLDMERFEADLQDDALRHKVRADIEQGLQLGVDVTPAVFLNGRRLYDIRPEALDIVIQHLVRAKKGGL